ncbi:MAG: hypothetical protein PW790_09095 [Parvibaculaceae bacterium]|nr:hypothetical protein [Parvibaculaceae bacterium]
MSWNIIPDPLLPWWFIALATLVTLAVLAFSLYVSARGGIWRAAAFALIVLAMINPAIRREEHTTLPDIAAILVDRSQSQNIGVRSRETDLALARLRKELSQMPNLETRIVEVPGSPDGADGTRLFGPLENALADVPRERLAGVIMITDGEVHDVPKEAKSLGIDAPLHAIIIGRKDEGDRRLIIDNAPRYGLVGQTATIGFRVVDEGPGNAEPMPATVNVHIDGKLAVSEKVTTGSPVKIEIPVAHAGANVIELDTEPGPRELTLINNRAVIATNGIRDRLRVLLVSGEPHPGERTWRNLLKADPSVDLVHFTILRPPEKQDGTPVDELALIAFPTDELFDRKLNQFDLIIFDRYRRRGVLPLVYLENVAHYVENGGAVLVASGPDFAGNYSLYRTPLAAVLPAHPTGDIFEGGFTPDMTSYGSRHPVTAGLPGDETDPPSWGRWFRIIDSKVDHGDTLMEGPGGQPLLVLDRVGKGRVAELMSDQIWLWSRGFEGGGPQAELLRRLAHWLMKEPDLEEESLNAHVEGNTLVIRRRTMKDTAPDATVTLPSGGKRTVSLAQEKPGLFTGRTGADEFGLYRISQDGLDTVAAAGPLNPLEFADVRATGKLLAPVAEATRGGIYWAGENAQDTPGVRSIRPGRAAAGTDWLGLRENAQYLVSDVKLTPLLTGPLALILILGALLLAWRREGR